MSIPHATSRKASRSTVVPRHVAIIMDGNRRWARARGLPAIEGHRRGIVALREASRAASDAGVSILTVYGFSTENWRREASEVSLLFELCVFFARTELLELRKNNVRVRVIGDWQTLPDSARRALEELQENTADCTGLLLQLAVNYSSRQELDRAVRSIAIDVASGALAAENVSEETLRDRLYTAGMPDPELLIRPGGEHRLSNFMLYQAAYSELVLTETLWPDFGRDAFNRALHDYSQRERRFGGA